jgi:hypothetical protein
VKSLTNRYLNFTEKSKVLWKHCMKV